MPITKHQHRMRIRRRRRRATEVEFWCGYDSLAHAHCLATKIGLPGHVKVLQDFLIEAFVTGKKCGEAEMREANEDRCFEGN